MAKEERIYRSSNDYVIAGVCGGLADYFKIDPTIVRLIFVVLALGGGSGVLIYLILWAILPKKTSSQDKEVKQIKSEIEKGPNQRGSILGLIVVIIGVVALWNQILPESVRWDLFWPIILIIAGLYLIFKQR